MYNLKMLEKWHFQRFSEICSENMDLNNPSPDVVMILQEWDVLVKIAICSMKSNMGKFGLHSHLQLCIR